MIMRLIREAIQDLRQPRRMRLPERREHESFVFQHWDMDYSAGFGRVPGEKPIVEVFLSTGKSGAQLETLARDSAIILSIAIQYGVPIEAFRHGITRNLEGKPSGPIGELLDIMVAS